MFRRLPNSLPKDVSFPANLEQLGYFVNESDQIRMVTKPEEKFRYAISRSDRVNEVHKEAMNCESALSKLNITLSFCYPSSELMLFDLC